MSEFEPYNFFGGVITGVIIVAFMVMVIMNQWNFSGTRKQNTYPQCCLHPKYHLKTIFLDDEKSRILQQIEGRMKLENPFTMFTAERLEEEFPIRIPTLSEQDIEMLQFQTTSGVSRIQKPFLKLNVFGFDCDEI